MEILLDPNIDGNKIAEQRPLQTQCSATFVVDVTHLAHPDDIKKDMYGKWLYKGSHTDVFRCTFDQDNKVCVEKAAPGASGSNIYYLRRLHSVHPSNKGFRRIVAIIFGMWSVYNYIRQDKLNSQVIVTIFGFACGHSDFRPVQRP